MMTQTSWSSRFLVDQVGNGSPEKRSNGDFEVPKATSSLDTSVNPSISWSFFSSPDLCIYSRRLVSGWALLHTCTACSSRYPGRGRRNGNFHPGSCQVEKISKFNPGAY